MAKRNTDMEYMHEALKLAESMHGRTSPDPMVGAVIVKDGRIVGRGYHAEVATPHAETFAIMKAGSKTAGGTMYVNLEPCCHHGNNPPCVDQIIAAGIKKVVAAMRDPNPLVSGKGFRKLKGSGVTVKVGVLEEEAKKLNEAFIKYITKKRPYVILKSAMSLDGKIATASGQSRWISSKKSRVLVHDLRNKVDAVMVGIGTVLTDDPCLTTRMVKGRRRNPLKIIIDPGARIPLNSNVLQIEPEKTFVVVSEMAQKSKVAKIKNSYAQVLEIKSKKGRLDLRRLMKVIADYGIVSVMIEGGGNLSAAAIEAGIVDKVMFFVSPKIIGGEGAPTPVEGAGVKKLSRALRLKDLKCSRVGEDLSIEGYIM